MNYFVLFKYLARNYCMKCNQRKMCYVDLQWRVMNALSCLLLESCLRTQVLERACRLEYNFTTSSVVIWGKLQNLCFKFFTFKTGARLINHD